MLPKSLEKSFKSGIVIPAKVRLCKECTDKIICDRCSIQINENKEFEANLYLLKRPPVNQFGHMLPLYKW